MDRPTAHAIEIIEQITAKNPDAAKALEGVLFPCVLRALMAAIPYFAAELGACLAENTAPDGYKPGEQQRCQ